MKIHRLHSKQNQPLEQQSDRQNKMDRIAYQAAGNPVLVRKPYHEPEFYQLNENEWPEEKLEAVIALIRHYEKILKQCG